MKTPIIEILLVIVLVLLAFTAVNPYVMPMGVFLTALLALIVLFGFFAVYIWREQGGDERETALRHRSDRMAFLAGATILLVAIVVEGITMKMVNLWVVLAFSAMVIVKVLGYIYNERKH